MKNKITRGRRADERDIEIGLRVRSRRLEQKLSQTELAERIGVTFQQVQKYEKGVNRIGSGRLARVAEALEVPVTFFFDGAGKTQHDEPSVFALLQNAASMRIVKAFARVHSHKARRLLVAMVEEFAEAHAA